MHMQEHLELWHSVYMTMSEVRFVLLSVLKVLERNCGLQQVWETTDYDTRAV
jgi:hypothetical protein